VTAVAPRPVSVAELQAALQSARRGDFAGQNQPPTRLMSVSTSVLPVTSPERDSGGSVGGSARSGGRSSGTSVLVCAGHAGAGASTIALLVADSLTALGNGTRLVECAPPARSAVAAATDTELGVDPTGWRWGRRGTYDIFRSADTCPDFAPGGADELVVVDAGSPVEDVLAAGNWVTDLAETATVLLVCRVTVPGVQRAEHALSLLPRPRAVLIVAVGPDRWPGAVAASCGPGLRELRAAGRVRTVPVDRGLETSGLTSRPLPKALRAAGRDLAIELMNLAAATTPMSRTHERTYRS